MAKIRMRHKDPKIANTGLTVVRSEKSTKAHNKTKLTYILLSISVLINIVLLIKSIK